MRTKNIFTLTVAALAVATIMGCSENNDYSQQYNPLIDDPKEEQPKEDEPGQSERTEQYRPQAHFTPAQNWMNDPNGMAFVDGTWHLFYQYNPQGNGWGNMSWGHATSTDLMHWQEQPVALTRDELGAIFSGSAVIDKDNTAGFGAGAMIALYTSAGETGDLQGKQQQSLAYSTDGGKNFTRYEANPVIKNDDDNLRDPKVFWHQESGKWIMALAKGWKRGVELYGSSDLKTWNHLSTFVVDLPGRPSLQWECPDLMSFDYKGAKKWVMIVSVNPGGPVAGSGTMYFVGDFDGTTFTADALDYPLWLDYGMDNYAGVTWSNTADRKVMIGWMNNWNYAGDVPCSPWRSAMTLPRELKLVEYDGKPLLTAGVVEEVSKIAADWKDVDGDIAATDAYQLRINVQLDKNSTITLSNGSDERYVIDINATARTMAVHRNANSGQVAFNGTFSIPSMTAPLNVDGNSVTLDIYVDQSSVELLSQGGAACITNLVFPRSIYNRVTVDGAASTAQYRAFTSIWK